MNRISVGAVRERERELYFSEIKEGSFFTCPEIKNSE